MFRALRTVFCILACLCVAAAALVGTFFGLLYALIAVAAALVFGILMLVFKDGNPFRKEQELPKTDFMNSEEENEKIRKSLEEQGQTPRE